MNKALTLLFSLALLLPSIAGCLESDIEYSSSIPKSSELEFSFKSTPNDKNELGQLSSQIKIYSYSTIDVLVEFNGSIIQHCGSFSEDGCTVGGANKEHSITSTTEFPTCYDDCRLELQVFYMGEFVAKFDAINF